MKTATAYIMTVEEARNALIDFYVEVLTQDPKNTRDLVAQKGGIGKAVPDIANMSDDTVINYVTCECPHIKENFFDEHKDCQILLMEKNDKLLVIGSVFIVPSNSNCPK